MHAVLSLGHKTFQKGLSSTLQWRSLPPWRARCWSRLEVSGGMACDHSLALCLKESLGAHMCLLCTGPKLNVLLCVRSSWA